MKEESYFLGIDVGTRSVRAALFSGSGDKITTCVIPISVFNPAADFYEQSSNEIWKSVCTAIQKVSNDVNKESIKGIGFDATCSLVIVDKENQPLSVSCKHGEDHNIVMWMDHRAKEEAENINKGNYTCLKYVGGKISLEMQIPKLLWLKKNLPEKWKLAEHFFDLPDFLTYKATGRLSRSLCSLICKWTFISDGVTQSWDKEFLSDIGLLDLLDNNTSKIGQTTLSPGDFVGGLTAKAAEEMGLIEGTPVGASILDAHAGGLALIFAGLDDKHKVEENFAGRLGLICGTSTCHMCLSRSPVFVEGVWGPALSAMVPKFWLNEGGQSATGSLVDHIVHNHPAANLCPKGQEIYEWLETTLEKMAEKEKLDDISFLTREFHLYPDFHGNRSPLADPSLKGMVCGLSLDSGVESLALIYLSMLQALAYGTKDIVKQLEGAGHKINTLLMCGGLCNSRIFIQTHADALDLPVLIPHTKESVLLGAAMLGASASGLYGAAGALGKVAGAMAGEADTINPRHELLQFHAKKFEVFKRMQTDQLAYREIMKNNVQ